MTKKIILKKLSYLNFKGGSEEIEFSPFVTDILGANKSGKTRVFDAYCWLLFNKNSKGVSDFNIQNLDASNNVIHKLEHYVEGSFEINNEVITLKRQLREKWVTPTGKAEEEYRGCENIYYVNGVKLSTEREWNEFITENFTDLKTLFLLTIPHAFASMHWEQQRLMLYKMAGITSKKLLCLGNNTFLDLIDKMKSEDTLKYKKEVQSKIQAISDQIKPIPIQIEENNKELESISVPVLASEQINKLLEEYGTKIKDLNTILNQKDVSTRISENQIKINDLREQINQLQRKQKLHLLNAKEDFFKDYNSKSEEYFKKKNEFNKLVLERDAKLNEIARLNSTIDKLLKEKEVLLEKYNQIYSEELIISDIQTICPTCKQELPHELIENKANEIRGNFNTNKAKRLEEISLQGITIAQNITDLKEQLSKIVAPNDVLIFSETAPEIPVFKDEDHIDQNINLEIDELLKSIESIELEMLKNASEEEKSREELTKSINKEIEDIYSSKQELMIQQEVHRRIAEKNRRITELKELHKKLAIEKSLLEKELSIIEEYDKYIINIVTNSVNHLFKYVEFKVFNILKNGNEEPTCTCMVNGVPYSDDNTASNVQSGLDIIQSLQNHFSVFCPVFIDDRDLVTDIPKMNCQVVNLIVQSNYSSHLTIKKY